MILESSLSLLFIEPTQPKWLHRSNQGKYRWLKTALSEGTPGVYNSVTHAFQKKTHYMGVHTCTALDCGERSSAYDILLPNNMITNSLAYHYVVYHSDEIPSGEWLKLDQLKQYLNLKIVDNVVTDVIDLQPSTE